MARQHEHALRPEQVTIPPAHSWNRIPVIAAVIAALGGVACAVLGMANPKQFYFSWLVSFLFFVSLAVGGESQTFVAYLLPVAAANFLYIAAADLIPELHRERGGAKALVQVALVVFGVLLMLGVKLFAE